MIFDMEFVNLCEITSPQFWLLWYTQLLLMYIRMFMRVINFNETGRNEKMRSYSSHAFMQKMTTLMKEEED